MCGLTAELNVKTDLEVYLSAKQLQIMMTASTLISQLVTPQYNPSASKGPIPAPGLLAQATTTDSGIESDFSHVSSHMFGRHTRNAGSKACTLPVDILLTAGRVSLALYTHQQQTMDYTPDAVTNILPQTPFSARKSEKSELLADNFIELTFGTGAEDEKSPAGNLCSSFDFVLQGESSQGSRAAVPAGTSCVQPFVYIYIAQPHTLVKFWPEVDKVEISCYDILVKGAEGVHVFPGQLIFFAWCFSLTASPPSINYHRALHIHPCALIAGLLIIFLVITVFRSLTVYLILLSCCIFVSVCKSFCMSMLNSMILEYQMVNRKIKPNLNSG